MVIIDVEPINVTKIRKWFQRKKIVEMVKNKNEDYDER